MIDGVKSKFSKVNYDETWAKIVQKKVPELTTQYDLALGFFLPFDFMKEKVNAKVKIGWIHTDYTSTGEDPQAIMDQYSGLDLIAAVSEETGEAFKKVCPSLKDKVIVVENILSKSFIEKQANEKIDDPLFTTEKIAILSIGRYCKAKNFDNVPDICSRIVKAGIDVKWYLIGYGGDEALIDEKIKEYYMEHHVIMLGKKNNPYPYIKECDLYVQPSRYEGKCVAVREAQLLNKPVVITAYPTSKSQLDDGTDGIIVPLDNEGCAKGIEKVLMNTALQKKLIAATKNRDYTNAEAVNILDSIIDARINHEYVS